MPASPPSVSRALSRATSPARLKMSPNPSYIQNVTNSPTAMKAASLTTDSNAIAATSPSWRSVASRWRVPKRMVKAASSIAM
ncbi:hypothetical protein D3C83_03810 [compost metagenome]